jgi:hypothetical protein
MISFVRMPELWVATMRSRKSRKYASLARENAIFPAGAAPSHDRPLSDVRVFAGFT